MFLEFSLIIAGLEIKYVLKKSLPAKLIFQTDNPNAPPPQIAFLLKEEKFIFLE